MITLMFTCNACGLEKIKVGCRARKQEEDVVEWVEQVASRAIHQHHQRISLLCENGKLDLYIPTFEGQEWVGQEEPI